MLLRLIFLALNLLASLEGAEYKRRHKRYLVYPDGGPARTQFIIGLGIPVDLKEQSVTVGTVIKFQYDLPTNSTEYTTRIYGFADTVSRDMDGNDKTVDEKTVAESDSRKNSKDQKLEDTAESSAEEDENSSESDKNSTESEETTEDNALVDITFKNRKRKSLSYSEGGVVGNYINTEIPLEEAIRRQEMIDKRLKELDEPPKRANRWDFYKIIEHMAERYGYSGRPCMLKTICEAAEIPFTHDNGLLGEIGHILFTPSTTKDELSHHMDNEYHAAERLGREVGVDCEQLFPECGGSVLDTFTQIGFDTLHKFGMY